MQTMKWNCCKKNNNNNRTQRVLKQMHVWGAWLCDSGYTMSHHRSTATKQRGTQPFSSKASLVTTAWKSVTWDITLSRPIQHCEEHNRQGWPFNHRLPLCRTTDRATTQSNKTNMTNSTGVWWEADLSSPLSCFMCTQFSIFWKSFCCLLKKNHYLKE